jgi:phytoene dehydrogenase-like protein
MAELAEHAVVLGASMGGLLAARVLADFYERVTVVERDVLRPTIQRVS